ncbi:carbon storage regulator, CsrA [Pirellula staleyi DSM 6068]|uniref:Translational regulator CsrA n=1 Tax=Pirellula staleyi (strain ATCC 27377 / DSM 6068 / ICPB 4128) TaxID=530564 RepID=D2R6Q2_PIRSD|nr:carbon storage regulator CsrA [Pirellula staleyi]ADB17352.1 carbon storage regulator, CsrA [Pirellula staleyi DSM 6068]
MLVLSRKKDERIVINGNIVITVVEVKGDKVRIGIEAPHEVPVHRHEVFEALARAHREIANGATKPDLPPVSTTER